MTRYSILYDAGVVPGPGVAGWHRTWGAQRPDGIHGAVAGMAQHAVSEANLGRHAAGCGAQGVVPLVAPPACDGVVWARSLDAGRE